MATETRAEAAGGSRRSDPRAGDAERLADVGKSEARAVWNEARSSVRSVLNERQSSTAADLGEFAEALRAAARNANPDRPVARIAAHAANSLEQLAGTLREKDFDGMVREVHNFARSQPAIFLGMAVAAGFLATRFLKSSPPGERMESSASGPAAEPAPQPASRPYAERAQSAPTPAPGEWPFPYDPRRT
ncbi:MAG TPA: hypothetical protein VFK15_07400 [Burkholderiales bacterium]|jgi:hypothetical protein|nr:hypothetical protein [Burkholderiales bacterium]